MSQEQKLTYSIVELAKQNDAFRKILWTGEQTQLVLMAIKEGGEIGGEVHEGHDQLLYFVEGKALATIGELKKEVQAGDMAIVPSSVYHNFQNIGTGMLKLYTTYSPPEHE